MPASLSRTCSGTGMTRRWLRGNAVTEQPPASRNPFSRGAGTGAKQKIRRVATNKVKARLTAFCVRLCLWTSDYSKWRVPSTALRAGSARHDVDVCLMGCYRNPRGSTTPFRTSALGVALALRGFRGGAPRRGGRQRLQALPRGRPPPMPLPRTTSSFRRKWPWGGHGSGPPAPTGFRIRKSPCRRTPARSGTYADSPPCHKQRPR